MTLALSAQVGSWSDRLEVTSYADGRPAAVRAYHDGQKAGTHVEWWPSGALRVVAQYSDDAYNGEYRSWYETGRPYELRHYAHGRESGMQQSWTQDGTLFLNYEVRDGRRYGLVNARPCVLTERDSTLPFYDSADFTPRWHPTTARTLDFTLTSQTGALVSARDLDGQIHVASFIFTRCSVVCPALMRQLKRVQSAAPGVRLVSYSVTPDLDTAATLAAYGKREGIDRSRWMLLTGDRGTITRLAREFYYADDGRLGPGSLLHTEKVLLVDGAGRLRGVYNGTVPFDIDRLLADIDQLKEGHKAR